MNAPEWLLRYAGLATILLGLLALRHYRKTRLGAVLVKLAAAFGVLFLALGLAWLPLYGWAKYSEAGDDRRQMMRTSAICLAAAGLLFRQFWRNRPRRED